MARKLDKKRYSKAGESLQPDDIAGKYAVVTIAEFGEIERDDESIGAWLLTREYGDKKLFLNMTMLDYLEEKLGGEDTDAWVGERIPLEKKRVRNPRTKEDVLKVYVCAPEDWKEIFSAAKKKGR